MNLHDDCRVRTDLADIDRLIEAGWTIDIYPNRSLKCVSVEAFRIEEDKVVCKVTHGGRSTNDALLGLVRKVRDLGPHPTANTPETDREQSMKGVTPPPSGSFRIDEPRPEERFFR